MEAWQERVVEERKQLDEQIEKLKAFLESPEREGLDADDAHLLVLQLSHMENYKAVLDLRIKKF